MLLGTNKGNMKKLEDMSMDELLSAYRFTRAVNFAMTYSNMEVAEDERKAAAHLCSEIRQELKRRTN